MGLNILRTASAPGELIKVNVPAITGDECEGVEVTRMGKRIYRYELVKRLDPRGMPYYWLGGPAPSGLAEPAPTSIASSTTGSRSRQSSWT